MGFPSKIVKTNQRRKQDKTRSTQKKMQEPEVPAFYFIILGVPPPLATDEGLSSYVPLGDTGATCLLLAAMPPPGEVKKSAFWHRTAKTWMIRCPVFITMTSGREVRWVGHRLGGRKLICFDLPKIFDFPARDEVMSTRLVHHQSWLKPVSDVNQPSLASRKPPGHQVRD